MWISETLIETNMELTQSFLGFSGEVSHQALHNRLQEVFPVTSLIHNRVVYPMVATLPSGGTVIEDSLVLHPIQEENHLCSRVAPFFSLVFYSLPLTYSQNPLLPILGPKCTSGRPHRIPLGFSWVHVWCIKFERYHWGGDTESKKNYLVLQFLVNRACGWSSLRFLHEF